MPRLSIFSPAERETLLALPDFGFALFTTPHHKHAVQEPTRTAMQTDKGVVLVSSLIEKVRQHVILLS
ncbi:hypothetical protein ACPOL_4718 [Acidisarcina polymorpha]|uniref:Uncharacterized protein n=1 Tax=Acidisarcina polymorpha TaxID=2211140 RepID=A0A2Z5G606_9BACT|nr:hypothetical protein [Acidisarcina polymorpha]AXC13986.1 hypothetical protein ACPOL_4718 [Acidisarcina polymorpha]